MTGKRKTVFGIIWITVVTALGMAMPFAATSHAAHPFPVKLWKYDGTFVAAGDNVPYSPKLSCVGCHNYSLITQGYHFQQGRTDGSGAVVVSDTFNATKPWILSAGMFGKW